mgnify:FL=1
MVNDLVSFKTMSKDDIMRLTGQEDDAGGSGSVLIPRLAINRAGEDDDGNKLESGTYTIYDPESEKKVYSKKGEVVKLRPFIRAYQYMDYNQKENKYTNKTIIFKSWKDEALDSNGGVKCGKIPFKELNSVSKEEALRQKDIKCYTLLYGLLNMNAVTGEGESTVLKDLPVLWRVTGTNFRPVNEVVKSIKNRNKLIQNVNLLLGTKRKKTGNNVYYISDIGIDDAEVEFTKDNFETMQMFSQIIKDENIEVIESWKSAQGNSEGGENPETISGTSEVVEAVDTAPKTEETPEQVLAT